MIKRKILIIVCLVIGTTIILAIENTTWENIDFPEGKNVTVKIGTFLGNEKRRFYGKGPVPEKLELIWKINLGTGETRIGGEIKKWSGWGWTGQPILIEENEKEYLIAGSYAHKLRKIEAETGKIVWEYSFDDVIKATPTILKDRKNRVLILCGSRKGVKKFLKDSIIDSYRAISLSGKEVWRLNIEKTESISRDVDGSCLFDTLTSLIYLGAENGIFYVIDPMEVKEKDGIKQPKIIKKFALYTKEDIVKHHGNLAIESSPALSGDIIYIPCGSGHIYGISKESLEIVWDFYIGSDLNGTAPITNDGCIIVPIEKEYITGKGGAIKLNPLESSTEAVQWFFPTGNREFAKWKGGIIGSVAINDEYNSPPKEAIAAFNGIDGYFYVVSQNEIEKDAFAELNGKKYKVPKLFYKKYIGGSISTPIFVDNYLVTCGYDQILRVFKIDYENNIMIEEIARFKANGSFESTPIIWNNRIYISCRDGFLYCLGTK